MIDKLEYVQIADLLMNTIVSTYADHEVALPTRRYLAVGGQGETVHDCEQVTVSFEQGYSGKPGNQATEPVRCDQPRTGVYIVEVVRSIPTTNTVEGVPATSVPSRYGQVATGVGILPAEVQSDFARKQMIDAMLMLDAGLRAAENTLMGAMVDVAAGPPQGGFQAMVMTVTASAVTSTPQFSV